MALIIRGDMPKACNWFDDSGKHRFCKVNAFCDCRIYTRDKRPSDCPILGEIPDEHGRLVDGDKLLADHNPNENWDYMVLECIIRNAPTVVEATT